MNDLQPIYCRFCKQNYMTTSGTVAAQKCDLCGKAGGLADPHRAVEEAREEFIERAKGHTRSKRVIAGLVGLFASIYVCVWKAWDAGVLFGSPGWNQWFDFGIWVVLGLPIWLASVFLLVRDGPNPNEPPASLAERIDVYMKSKDRPFPDVSPPVEPKPPASPDLLGGDSTSINTSEKKPST